MKDKVSLFVPEGVYTCATEGVCHSGTLGLALNEDEGGRRAELCRLTQSLGKKGRLCSARKSVYGDGQRTLGRVCLAHTGRKGRKLAVGSDKSSNFMHINTYGLTLK